MALVGDVGKLVDHRPPVFHLLGKGSGCRGLFVHSHKCTVRYFCSVQFHPLLLATLATCCITTGCAIKGAPSGGPPDTTPPEVVRITPEDGSRNVTDPSITIEFSEYVDRGVRNALRIQPRVRFASTYAGDEVRIDFEEPLAPNTTYTLTLGTDWRDLKGNSPQEATSVTFSTGNDIDTGRFSGRVYGRDLRSVVVFVYDVSGGDSTHPMRDQPQYIMPLGSSGVFSVEGLKQGLYRVMAVQDANSNNLLDASEQYAMASEDVVVWDTTTTTMLYMLLGPSVAMQQDSTIATDTVHTEQPPGRIEGTVERLPIVDTTYLARFIDSASRSVRTTPIAVGKPWVVPEIPPGRYAVDVFIDLNANGAYDHGYPVPFRHAEPWLPTSVTVTVRPRWTTDGVLILAP